MTLELYFDIKLCTGSDVRVTAYLVDEYKDTVITEAECGQRMSGSKETVERYFGRQGGISYQRLDLRTAQVELLTVPGDTLVREAKLAWTDVADAWKWFIPAFLKAGVDSDDIFLAMLESGYSEGETKQAIRKFL